MRESQKSTRGCTVLWISMRSPVHSSAFTSALLNSVYACNPDHLIAHFVESLWCGLVSEHARGGVLAWVPRPHIFYQDLPAHVRHSSCMGALGLSVCACVCVCGAGTKLDHWHECPVKACPLQTGAGQDLPSAWPPM